MKVIQKDRSNQYDQKEKLFWYTGLEMYASLNIDLIYSSKLSLAE